MRKRVRNNREIHLKRAYGLTEEDYQRMVRAQHGVCKICLKIAPNGRLYVDHDHQTGMIRGLLCATCNTFIGRLGEDSILLDRASAYLGQFRPTGFAGRVKHVDLTQA